MTLTNRAREREMGRKFARTYENAQDQPRAERKAEFEKIVDRRYRAALKKAKKSGLVSIRSETIHDPIQFKLIATAILNASNAPHERPRE